jgi:hypothetical protein
VLSAALDYDTLSGVRSTALILASRIQDHPTTLGVPRTQVADRPLPWLPSPRTGHPGWNDYLKLRAQLITNRVTELRSLTEAYRELYRSTHLPPGDIGRPPADSGQQRTAYHAVVRSLASDHSDPPSAPPTSRRALPSPGAAPVRSSTPSNARTVPTRRR